MVEATAAPTRAIEIRVRACIRVPPKGRKRVDSVADCGALRTTILVTTINRRGRRGRRDHLLDPVGLPAAGRLFAMVTGRRTIKVQMVDCSSAGDHGEDAVLRRRIEQPPAEDCLISVSSAS